ncbi:MAG TPA: hypothetical protein PK054_11855 [Anaerohalosphaeraceae bacterium]|nr:hypothetical protein [Anaerohalosphaeraceae bacterium]HPP57258.1 hypothetical protein [Anaerohalosphaeraceae bacterium]
MKTKHVLVWIAFAVLTSVLLAADEEPKVNPKVTALLEQLTKAAAEAAPDLSEAKSDDEKKQLTESHAKLQKFITEKLIPLCTNPVFVKETAAQNAKGVSLDEIKKTDEQWQKAEEELPIHKEKMNNACAAEIKRLIKEVLPNLIGECFVMDNQGANVGQNVMTSDYWQGDEPKWQKSFNEGKGGLIIEKRKYDKSTDTVDQKVSLPIIDTEGNVIGAVCWGVKVDKL